MPKAEFNISHRPCAFQAVGNWMTYYCGQVKEANIMTSSFISNFSKMQDVPGFHTTGQSLFAFFWPLRQPNLPPRGTQEMVANTKLSSYSGSKYIFVF